MTLSSQYSMYLVSLNVYKNYEFHVHMYSASTSSNQGIQ